MPKQNKSAKAGFTFYNPKTNVVKVLDTRRKNLSAPSPAAVTYAAKSLVKYDQHSRIPVILESQPMPSTLLCCDETQFHTEPNTLRAYFSETLVVCTFLCVDK